jgi:DNA-binding XRE family transcriptional regulator
MNNKKMDNRCPRKLDVLPENWCPLAVLRLKAIRNSGKELSEEEETKLPGCPWSIDHQLAGYCFFKYLSEYTSEKTISDMELAALLNVSIDTIKKIEKGALVKMRNHSTLSSLKTDGEPIVTERDASHKIYR